MLKQKPKSIKFYEPKFEEMWVGCEVWVVCDDESRFSCLVTMWVKDSHRENQHCERNRNSSLKWKEKRRYVNSVWWWPLTSVFRVLWGRSRRMLPSCPVSSWMKPYFCKIPPPRCAILNPFIAGMLSGRERPDNWCMNCRLSNTKLNWKDLVWRRKRTKQKNDNYYWLCSWFF